MSLQLARSDMLGLLLRGGRAAELLSVRRTGVRFQNRRFLFVLVLVTLAIGCGLTYLQSRWHTQSFRESMYSSGGVIRPFGLEMLLGERNLSARWHSREFSNFFSLTQFWPETIIEIRDSDGNWLMDFYGNEGYTRFRCAPRVPRSAIQELEDIKEVVGNDIRNMKFGRVRAMLQNRTGA